jgi:hypothetical protein
MVGGAGDVMPSDVPGVSQPVHQLLLAAMGTPILDNCNCAETAAADGSKG